MKGRALCSHSPLSSSSSTSSSAQSLSRTQCSYQGTAPPHHMAGGCQPWQSAATGKAIDTSSRVAVVPKGEWKLYTISQGNWTGFLMSIISHDHESHTCVLDSSPSVKIPSRSPPLTRRHKAGMFRSLPNLGLGFPIHPSP